MRATELAPSNGEYHLLVSDLASQAGQYELAWEYAIRAAQTGVATDFEFDALAGSAPSPVDIRERLDAPRVAVLTDPAGETVYEKNLRFDDLDDHGENAEELARHVGEILERTSAPGR